MPQGKALVFTVEQLSDIKTRYLAGQSAVSIGKAYGCAHTVITRLARVNGYKRTSQEASALTRKTVDESYFDVIDTEAKAYWLGFLYADGGITVAPQKALYLGLAAKDRSHVVALQTALQTDFAVGDYTNSQGHDIAVLRVSNNKIVDALVAQGCTERKTFALEPPTPDQVPSDLIRHFVRGYLDGDGCIYKDTIIFLGTENLMNWISQNLPFEHKAKVAKPSGKNIFRLSVSFRAIDKHYSLYSWLYEDASIWLERKRLKIEPDAFQHRSDYTFIPLLVDDPIIVSEPPPKGLAADCPLYNV